MVRLIALMTATILGLVACTPVTPTSGADGAKVAKVYRIGRSETGKLQFRMLDSVNALRQAQGMTPVTLNPRLNAAAATHSRDMSVQNRPWHFGSDGSSPIDRVQRVGYTGQLVGENISETYETELETLAAWLEQPDTKRTLLAPDARDMGFAWHQESNGKIWWTLVMGNPSTAPVIPQANPSASRLVPERVDNPETAAGDETGIELFEETS